jgi:formylglycine-generating enzyme required for sulfatase activity
MIGMARLTIFYSFIGAACISCTAQEEKASLPKEITNSIGMKFVLIPAGRFMMGSPAAGQVFPNNEVLHEVELTQPFYLGTTEVTEHQWARVMEDEFETKVIEIRDPDTQLLIRKEEQKIRNTKLGSQLPMRNISWTQAVKFCRRLEKIAEEKEKGRNYRLPTESQWEYACRAGTSTAYSFGDSADALGEYGWFQGNSNGSQPVGKKMPNAWGLYDMHGNVLEWCSDWHGDYPGGLAVDPTGSTDGSHRVTRGGFWFFSASGCRSAYRSWLVPTKRGDYLGFRVHLSSSAN